MNEIPRVSAVSNGFTLPEFPKIDPATLRSAVAAGDGETALVEQQLRLFDRANSRKAEAQAEIVSASIAIAELTAEKARLQRRRARTDDTQLLIVAEQEHRPPWVHRVTAVLFAAAAALALWASNQVGANYLAKSPMDLYALDYRGASLFLLVEFIAAMALKAFEVRLGDDRARRTFRNTVAGMAIGAFLGWVVLVALTFAPASGESSTSWLNGSANYWERAYSIGLVLSHLLADVGCGFILFTSAEAFFLAGRKRIIAPNPLHDLLGDEITSLTKAIDAERSRKGRAEDYLAALAAGQAEIERTARFAFRSTARQLEQSRLAAAATAELSFHAGK